MARLPQPAVSSNLRRPSACAARARNSFWRAQETPHCSARNLMDMRRYTASSYFKFIDEYCFLVRAPPQYRSPADASRDAHMNAGCVCKDIQLPAPKAGGRYKCHQEGRYLPRAHFFPT